MKELATIKIMEVTKSSVHVEVYVDGEYTGLDNLAPKLREEMRESLKMIVDYLEETDDVEN